MMDILQLTHEEQAMLNGEMGRAVQKCMQILHTLGRIYGASRLIPIRSVQVAGVSYDNLGEAGLEFLQELADGGGRARVLTTLNPAGMDMENWPALGIPAEFARNQELVLQAFSCMGIIPTCTCTPYLVGNLPRFGEHIAWSESSAVCYSNSVLGARSNREGGPSALAAALTGLTPEYGLHLIRNRHPGVTVNVDARLVENHHFGALGMVLGTMLIEKHHKAIPWICGIHDASPEQLKTFCASIATYGGIALFHIENITPESKDYPPPVEEHTIRQRDLDRAIDSQQSATSGEVDFISLGCPHLGLQEITRLAQLLKDKKVKKEFWITTARPIKQMADRAGYTAIIEASGAKFAADTCCVVAPIAGRFHAMATDSAKACYYAAGKNRFKTILRSFDEVIEEALR